MNRILSVLASVAAGFTISIPSIAHADLTEKLRPIVERIYVPHALAECRLPEFDGPIEALTVRGNIPQRLDLPPLYGLVLLSLSVDSFDDSDLTFSVNGLPLLPEGGIDEADLCGPVETQRMRVPAIGERAGIIGLRMRPSLDLAKAYPLFGENLAKSNRVVRTKPKSFAAFRSFPNDEKILREALSDHPMIQSDRNIWTMPGLILMPLAQ